MDKPILIEGFYSKYSLKQSSDNYKVVIYSGSIEECPEEYKELTSKVKLGQKFIKIYTKNPKI